MVCELLTDGVDGGPAPIPMWMLRECYVFLAELDCSVDQRFVNGRKVMYTSFGSRHRSVCN